MKEIFIYLLIILIVFLIVKTFQSKESLKLKLTESFILLIGLYFCLIHLITSGWEKGIEQQPVESPSLTKSIFIFNETNKPINAIIDFKYSKDERLKYANINIQYNKIDTLFNIERGKSKSYLTPISQIDSSVSFPEKFNIKITNSTGEVLKTYNKDEFINNIETINKNRKDREYVQMSWTLRIK